jgi:hypothetical protein
MRIADQRQPSNPRDRTPLGVLRLGVNEASSETAFGQDGADFTWTFEPIVGDLLAIRRLRAAELRFEVQFSPGVGSVA